MTSVFYSGALPPELLFQKEHLREICELRTRKTRLRYTLWVLHPCCVAFIERPHDRSHLSTGWRQRCSVLHIQFKLASSEYLPRSLLGGLSSSLLRRLLDKRTENLFADQRRIELRPPDRQSGILAVGPQVHCGNLWGRAESNCR